MPVLRIQELSANLSGAAARWRARQTPQSNLSDGEKKALLGVIVNEALRAAAMAPAAVAAAAAPAFAPAVDWRNRNGNHVTGVKDQKVCGSCVSFCSSALVESMASIEKGQLPDLSEADLHFCSSHGASCGGWWPDQALGEVQSRGVVPESAFSYMSAFASPPVVGPDGMWVPHCVNVPNRAAIATKITSHGTLASATDRKNYLSNTGPCSAVFDVYDDFFSYGSGVYHHVTGNLAGSHCVEVIGSLHER